MPNTNSLSELLINLDEENLLLEIDRRLKANYNPLSLIDEMRGGMKVVGDKYEEGEYFLGELLVAAEALNKSIEIIKPYLPKNESGESKGKIVIGTVKTDIHTIGKDIVATLLECEGYEVFNLGVDVPPEKFVDKVKEVGAYIVGLSTLMTPGIEWMKLTVEAFEKAGLRDSIVIIIGGAVLYGNPEKMVEHIKPDKIGRDALEALRLVKKIMAERKNR
ncbi:MAG: cobalamin B12-binding domain-containing protein [Candidatus Ranarchaeia archaeon]